MGLYRLGEAHSVILPIKHSVVLPNEHIAQDPQGSGGGWDIQAHEAAQTDLLSGLAFLQA